MKKIFFGLATIGFMALVIGGTLAYFSDREVSTNNTITSGTLKIDVNNNNSSGTFTFDLGNISTLAPGDKTGTATITVKNVGNFNAATFGRFTISADTGLSNVLKLSEYKVEYFNADGTPAPRWNATDFDPYFGETINQDWWIKNGVMHPQFVIYGGNPNLMSWITGNGALDIPGYPWDEEGLKPGEYYTITFQFQMDPTAGNAYQDTSVTLGYEVKATQINADALNALGLGPADMSGHVSYLLSQVTP